MTTKRSGRSHHTTRSSSTSSKSSDEVSRRSSPSPAKVGKKGKTRMPKRLVRKEAIIHLGFPFEEEVRFMKLIYMLPSLTFFRTTLSLCRERWAKNISMKSFGLVTSTASLVCV